MRVSRGGSRWGFDWMSEVLKVFHIDLVFCNKSWERELRYAQCDGLANCNTTGACIDEGPFGSREEHEQESSNDEEMLVADASMLSIGTQFCFNAKPPSPPNFPTIVRVRRRLSATKARFHQLMSQAPIGLLLQGLTPCRALVEYRICLCPFLQTRSASPPPLPVQHGFCWNM